jgi:hypothetical protein
MIDFYLGQYVTYRQIQNRSKYCMQPNSFLKTGLDFVDSIYTLLPME